MCGRHVSADRGLAYDPVQSFIGQRYRIPFNLCIEPAASAFAGGAAHFKHIGEIRIESQVNRNLEILQSMIHEQKLLETRIAPQEPRAHQMQYSSMDGEGAIARDVEICQIGSEQKIVGGYGGTQQQGASV